MTVFEIGGEYMLGKKIKEYLRVKGIKQNYLAEQIGMNEKSLYAMLNGQRKVQAEEYFKICKALNVDLSTFAITQKVG